MQSQGITPKNGLDYTIRDTSLSLRLHPAEHLPRMPFPLAPLVAGEAFKFDTGFLKARLQSTSDRWAVISDLATVTFTPVQQ